jgi:undecaprenyl-diphosphatase
MDPLIIFLAKYLIVGVILVLAITWLKLSARGRKELVVAVIIAGLIAAVLTKLTGKIYFHPRPFAVQHIKPLIPHAADNGFPSEHTVLAMTLTAVIYYYRKKLALAAFVLTLGVGIGRVLAHVHSPLDIVGGLAVGAAAGALGFYSSQKLIPTLLNRSSSRS